MSEIRPPVHVTGGYGYIKGRDEAPSTGVGHSPMSDALEDCTGAGVAGAASPTGLQSSDTNEIPKLTFQIDYSAGPITGKRYHRPQPEAIRDVGSNQKC